MNFDDLVDRVASVMMAMYGDSNVPVTLGDIKKTLRKAKKCDLEKALDILEGRK